MPRIRRVESEREKDKAIDDFVTRGYKVQEQGQYSSKVKAKEYGSAPVHGFVFLFTLLGAFFIFDAAGIGTGGAWVAAIVANLVYATYTWFTAEEVIIRVDQES